MLSPPQSKTPSLIFEYINNTDFRSLYPKFQDYDVRYYIYELLKVSVFQGVNIDRRYLVANLQNLFRHSTFVIARVSCIETSSPIMS